jgi:hypothetical protein
MGAALCPGSRDLEDGDVTADGLNCKEKRNGSKKSNRQSYDHYTGDPTRAKVTDRSVTSAGDGGKQTTSTVSAHEVELLIAEGCFTITYTP